MSDQGETKGKARFSALMSPKKGSGVDQMDQVASHDVTTVPTPVPESVPAAVETTTSAPEPTVLVANSAVSETGEKKSRAKVQLNTQQPEELKNAVDKAAAYLSFTTGRKVTTTDVVERALRMYLEQLPDAARGN